MSPTAIAEYTCDLTPRGMLVTITESLKSFKPAKTSAQPGTQMIDPHTARDIGITLVGSIY